MIAAITAALSPEDFSGKIVISKRIDIESIDRTIKTIASERIQLSKKSEFSTAKNLICNKSGIIHN